MPPMRILAPAARRRLRARRARAAAAGGGCRDRALVLPPHAGAGAPARGVRRPDRARWHREPRRGRDPSLADGRARDDRGGAAPRGAGARRVPRRPAAGAGGRRRSPSARRTGPEIGWNVIQATDEQADDELFGDLPPAFDDVRVARVLLHAARRGDAAVRHGALQPGVPLRPQRVGHAVPLRGEPDTIRYWLDTARDEAIAHGVDIERGARGDGALRRRRRWSSATASVARFGAIVGRYAGAR